MNIIDEALVIELYYLHCSKPAKPQRYYNNKCGNCGLSIQINFYSNPDGPAIHEPRKSSGGFNTLSFSTGPVTPPLMNSTPTISLFRQLEPYFAYVDAKQLNAATVDLKSENQALKTTVLKLQDQDICTAEQLKELMSYKDNFEKVVTFLKQIFPEKAEAIENLTQGQNEPRL